MSNSKFSCTYISSWTVKDIKHSLALATIFLPVKGTRGEVEVLTVVVVVVGATVVTVDVLSGQQTIGSKLAYPHILVGGSPFNKSS